MASSACSTTSPAPVFSNTDFHKYAAWRMYVLNMDPYFKNQLPDVRERYIWAAREWVHMSSQDKQSILNNIDACCEQVGDNFT